MPDVDSLLASLVATHQAPSVQYALFDADAYLCRRSLGLAHVQPPREATAATTYHVFSVTKTVTALAVLQLAARGAVSLDGAACRYVPALPFDSAITLRHLLTHTAGLPNPLPLGWVHPAAAHAAFDRDAFFAPLLRRYAPRRARPNERFAYSNLGYVVLGQVIEHVAGGRYEDYVRAHVLAPLGLGPAELGFAVADAGPHATGYHDRASWSYLLLGWLLDKAACMGPPEGRWRPFRPLYVNGASYGGLLGTADALVRYLQDLLRPDGVLLPAAAKRALFTENRTAAGRPTGMCLAWFRGRVLGQEYVAHAGGGGGYYAEIRLYPALGRGSVLLLNRTGLRDERLLDRVDAGWLTRPGLLLEPGPFR
ncbi:beta-lactamase family protein [Hymenobacter sp. BT683]|uniref:Beta-lactamase family protein n=1 Tax=Hymenobacter jeongseonensis TaxID=2791027 RepID=A0ABS0INK2_9BACT|nr:serine hydrolase domain-containing protein [Hymenobacter jeongseonensis]MBF9239956.1 beta-lactamase family protein [Hymenobacter jeongseonensis]